MNDPEKRTCPFCAEIIKAQAKVCPHCRQWLTLKSFRHPLVYTIVHLVPMLVIWVAGAVAVFSILDRMQNPRPFYSEFPHAFRVLESRMNWAETKDGLRLFVTGVLTNDSPETWGSVEFDCRFLDAQGVMVDASTGYGRVTVGPHDDSAFRVSVLPIAPRDAYASLKFSVGNARNTKGLF